MFSYTAQTAVDMYSDTVYRIALSHTHNRQDADDIYQEVFLLLCRKNPEFNDAEHMKAWLIRCTLNYCKRTAHKNSVRLRESNTYTDTGICFERDDENAVFEAIGKLKKQYSTVVMLFYFEDMSIEQIAKTIGVRQGTVKSRLSRARRLMEEMLKGELFDE